eukprot:3176080-Pyramimonas_sp.AAC.1
MSTTQADMHRAALAMPRHKEGRHHPNREALHNSQRVRMEVVLRVARLRLLPRILPHASSSLLRILDPTCNAAGAWANALMQDAQWLNTR